ncbi:extracellular solute-binding protein [Pelagibius sp. CAU 1746]|uniref:extracellular solute-binding protein n=1 Tax=Pelagibius sp. CAU 1746 TaxID=3140370 RepID=UPI00325B5F4E
MTIQKTDPAWARGAISRRRALQLGAGSALALSFGALSGGKSMAASEVTLFTWETYHEPDWVQAYQQASGVKVNVVNTGSVDEMYAQTRSGSVKADVLYFDTGSFPRYIDAGLIAPFDAAQVPNRKNVSKTMGWEEKCTVGGKLWGIPYNWGTQPLMYDKRATDGEPLTWAALWDKKYKGKVNMFDDAYITIPMIALYVGAADPFNMSDKEFEEVRKALKALRPQVRTIARGFDDATNIYASGEAVIGYCQNIAIVNDLQAKGLPFAYSFPDEGTPTWIDCSVVTEQGNRPEVYSFIDANLTPEWQVRMTEFSLNNGVLSAEVAEGAGLSGEVIKKTNIADQAQDGFWDKMVVFQPPEDIDRRLEVWNDFKAGTL